MPTLSERARRARRHFGTDTPVGRPVDQHDTVAERAPQAVTDPEPSQAAPAEPAPATAPVQTAPAPQPGKTRIARTRTSGIWVAVIVAVLVLVFLLIFILQNLAGAQVFFLGASGTLPLGVAMLLAAVAGALLIGLFGSARILQLRHTARRRRH